MKARATYRFFECWQSEPQANSASGAGEGILLSWVLKCIDN